MSETPDPDPAAALGDSDALDPRAAAALLDEATIRAQRELEFRSPLLSLLAAAVVLVAFGAIWLSVRDQHPYKGPTVAGLAGLYLAVLIRLASVAYAYRRATTGVSGHSIRRRRAEGIALAVSLTGVYVLMAPLANAGASDSVVYGVYAATATLLILGVFWAARSAAQDDPLDLGLSVALIVVAVGSAFAGPRGVWLSDGIGCCIVLLGYSAIQAWLPRSARSQA
jgi:hypothetical protein